MQATASRRLRLRDLVGFPTPTVSLELPGCAIHSCADYLAAGIACATAPAVNDCYCSKLTWPTACKDVCFRDAHRTSVARWYWALCPSAMDIYLGRIGVSNAKSSGIQSTVDSWAVQTSAVAGGLPVTTGYDCYYSSRCDKSSTVPKSSTDPSTTTAANLMIPANDGPKTGDMVLGICVPLVVLVAAWRIYSIIRHRRHRRDAQSGRQLPSVLRPDHDLVLAALLHSQTTQNANMQRIATSLERLLRAPASQPTENAGTFRAVPDELDDLLTCPICILIFHNPVSVISARTNENGGCCKSSLTSTH